MKINKYLFFIKDNLENYDDLLHRLKKEAPFRINIINYKSFKNTRYKNTLKQYNPSNVIIALDINLYKDMQKELLEYLRSVYHCVFTNILLINTTIEFKTDNDTLIGKKHCFFMCNKSKPESNVYNLILYSIKMYNEAVLSNRLVDYITHSFDSIVSSELLKKKKEQIELLNKELEEKNKTDHLTRLFNRQAIFEFLEKESKRTKRDIWRISNMFMENDTVKVSALKGEYDTEPIGDLFDHIGIFSVLMIDVDHFKMINDTHGHLIGDTVLKAIGDLMRKPGVFRESDILGRFGGEEFIGILPGTNVNNALGPAIRFTKALRQIDFRNERDEIFKTTVSIGISEFHPKDTSKEDIIQRADKALYWAKDHGRDQIAIYEKIFK
ncbi:MAG: GGDEF domain-containing protein [Spirochaetales bacterium]|nr:GGDEF domain-containing protein [Spirochaetales bacterium]